MNRGMYGVSSANIHTPNDSWNYLPCVCFLLSKRFHSLSVHTALQSADLWSGLSQYARPRNFSLFLPSLLKRVTSECSFEISEKISYNFTAWRRNKNKSKQNKEKRKRTKESPLDKVKPLNPNKSPSFMFFSETMITMKTDKCILSTEWVWFCFLKTHSTNCLSER